MQPCGGGPGAGRDASPIKQPDPARQAGMVLLGDLGIVIGKADGGKAQVTSSTIQT
jgi:hypothetical protein